MIIWPFRASTGLAVDFDIDDIVAHAAASDGCIHDAATVVFTTMYSNSCLKCFRKLCTGHAAASPSAQIVWPFDFVRDVDQTFVEIFFTSPRPLR